MMDCNTVPPPGARISLSDAEMTPTRTKVLHNGGPCRVVLAPTDITVGCHTISLAAAKFLLAEHANRFPEPRPYTLQP